jgi:hypothetical protein
VPIAELRAREPKAKTTASKGKPGSTARGKGGRALREQQPPSWERAFKRGGTMGALMLLAFLFLFKNAPIGLRVAWGAFYALAFIPLTYFIDRTAYRSYLRRSTRSAGKKN